MLDTDKHLNNDERITRGPIVIDHEGRILSGHDRHSEIQEAYLNSPHDAARYKMDLINKSPAFGINPIEIMNKKHPVLVRKIDHSDLPHS